MEPALPERSGPGTGAAGLSPPPPSSVAPKGSPVGLIDTEGRADGAVSLSAQESDAPPESPPPSNRAPGDPVLPDPAQVPMPPEGLTGDTPRVAISVDPSGMAAGRVDRKASGEVAPMPMDGCTSGDIA
jgi:hypothetical protein